MSRRAFVPTEQHRETVLAMAAYGIPQEDIARVIGCSHPILRKYFRNELDIAVAKANAKVASTLFSIATDKKHPSVASSAIFWLKTRAHWRETGQNESKSADIVISGGLPDDD